MPVMSPSAAEEVRAPSTALSTLFLLVLLSSPPCCSQRASPEAVTEILDGLLNSYDKSIRPMMEDGEPISIRISINVRSMGPISDKDETFSVDCYFRQLWTDVRLNFSRNSTGFGSFQLNEKFLHEIWRPDTYFLNGHASYLHNITSPNVLIRIKNTGEILYSMRLTIKAQCPMDFHRYPMDTQHCPLYIGSHGYSLSDLTYAWRYNRQSSIETAANLMMSQFDLVKVPTSSRVQELGRMGNFSILCISFVLKRHVGYFLIQLYLPCALLVVLSWVSFWLNREATADRVALSITTVLTMAFLFMDSRTDLPRVSYSTALDWYVAVCFVFVLSTLLQFAAVHYFTKYGTGELYLVLEEAGASGSSCRLRSVESKDLICWTSGVNDCQQHRPVMTVAAAPTRRRHQQRSCLRDLAGCLQGSVSYKASFSDTGGGGGVGGESATSRPLYNSVSVIDRASRGLFPAAFALVNVTYWSFYLYFYWTD